MKPFVVFDGNYWQVKLAARMLQSFFFPLHSEKLDLKPSWFMLLCCPFGGQLPAFVQTSKCFWTCPLLLLSKDHIILDHFRSLGPWYTFDRDGLGKIVAGAQERVLPDLMCWWLQFPEFLASISWHQKVRISSPKTFEGWRIEESWVNLPPQYKSNAWCTPIGFIKRIANLIIDMCLPETREASPQLPHSS